MLVHHNKMKPAATGQVPLTRRRWRALFAAAVLCIALLLTLQAIQFHFADRESPLDHAKTTLLKPFYRLQCRASWTTTSRPVDAATCDARRPPIAMISARQPHERVESFASWKSHEIHMINTTALSQELTLRVESECPSHAWAYRLFLVYQLTFTRLLDAFPTANDFVMLEDDAVLADADQFAMEVCRAQSQQLPFFSLYYVPGRQDACLYHSGTVSFYITRAMMHRVIQVPTPVSCRLPIDIFLATSGPWFATEQDVILHRSQRTGTRTR